MKIGKPVRELVVEPLEEPVTTVEPADVDEAVPDEAVEAEPEWKTAPTG